MKTADASDRFGYSESSIRNWVKEFGEYLSPTARGIGKSRHYSEDDLEVLALIAKMKNEGHLEQDIHASLRAGQRETPPVAYPPDIPQSVVVQLENLAAEVERLKAFEDDNVTLRIEKAQLEAKLAMLRERIDELKGDLINAKEEGRKLGLLEGKLAALEQRDGK